MSWLHRWTIREKLIFIIATLLLVSFGEFVSQWRTIERLEDELTFAVGESVPIINAIHKLRFGALRVVSSTSEYLFIVSNSNEYDGADLPGPGTGELNLINEGNEVFTDALTNYVLLLKNGKASHEEAELSRELGRSLVESSKQIVQQMKQSSDIDKLLEMKEVFEEHEQALLTHLEVVLVRHNSILAARRAALDVTVSQARWIYLLAFLGTVIVLSVFTFIFSYSVVRPIHHLGQIALRIGEGDFNTRADVPGRDEIGTLAGVINKMAEHLGSTTVSRDALRQIIASMSDGLLVVDVAGSIEQVNPEAVALLGSTLDELVGKKIDSIIGSEPALELRNSLDNTVNLQLQDDIPVLATQRNIIDLEGDLKGSVIVLLDLRERLAVEGELREAKQKAELSADAKAQFLANMSHEIRTPLHGVLGMLNLLESTDLTEAQRKLLETAAFSANGLLTVVNDVLDFSKVDAGKLVLETRKLDLRTIIENVLMTFASRAQSMGIEICSEFEEGVETSLIGDPERLAQILVNLVGNAVKFTEHGHIVVRVLPAGSSAETTDLRFEVQDSGVGIAADTCKQLFCEFVQGDTSVTRRYGGTGLGLAIAKHLVTLMDGDIGVISSPGVGSTFWFTARFSRDTKHVDVPVPDMDVLNGARVLVVVDNNAYRKILDRQLLRWHMQSHMASDAEAALAMLREAATRGESFQVALLDKDMPGMDGLALAQTIKADTSIANTPLVLLTPVESNDSEVGDSGIVTSLVKPIHQDNLLNVLFNIFGVQKQIPVVTANAASNDANALIGTHVLLAEDNEINQTVAKAVLKSLGCGVTVASNGAEAIVAAAKKQYDIVLMDCQMPGTDGYEATEKIRLGESQLAKKRVPIVALTAHAIDGDRDKCLAAGMDDYMSKPFTRDQLTKMLLRWVAN